MTSGIETPADQPARGIGLGRLGAGKGISVRDAFGPAALLDSGLPSLVFITVFALVGQRLEPALWSAVAAGAVLAVARLARRESLQNVLAGFIGLAIAAWFSARTGKAENFFLPGLLINVVYGVAYVVSIVVRWPLLGVVVAGMTQEGMGWRRDPGLLRAYALASWLWVVMFSLRIAVQLPLYLAGDVVALGIARLAMGWPLFFITIYLSWLIIRRARDEHVAAQAAAA